MIVKKGRVVEKRENFEQLSSRQSLRKEARLISPSARLFSPSATLFPVGATPLGLGVIPLTLERVRHAAAVHFLQLAQEIFFRFSTTPHQITTI